jgi:hypothetical protein
MLGLLPAKGNVSGNAGFLREWLAWHNSQGGTVGSLPQGGKREWSASQLGVSIDR